MVISFYHPVMGGFFMPPPASPKGGEKIEKKSLNSIENIFAVVLGDRKLTKSAFFLVKEKRGNYKFNFSNQTYNNHLEVLFH